MSSPTDLSEDQRRSFLDAQLREIYGRVVYTHKVHEKQAETLLLRSFWIKLFQILLSALSAAGFVAVLADQWWWGSLAGAIFSFLLLVLNLYTRTYDLGQAAQENKAAAIKIWIIRERCLSLITDLATGYRPTPDILRGRDALNDELGEVYASAPTTTKAAYRKAHKALNLREEMTFAAEEVDAFLPEALRRERKGGG